MRPLRLTVILSLMIAMHAVLIVVWVFNFIEMSDGYGLDKMFRIIPYINIGFQLCFIVLCILMFRLNEKARNGYLGLTVAHFAVGFLLTGIVILSFIIAGLFLLVVIKDWNEFY